MARALRLLVALLVSGAAAAQPALTVSTDTLHYGEHSFTATNVSLGSVSVSFPATDQGYFGTSVGYGWGFEVETPDSLYTDVWLPYWEDVPVIDVGPGETATFRVVGFDPCPPCRRAGIPDDALRLRVAGASAVDTVRVVLSMAGYVSTEPELADGLGLEAYPNPTSGVVILRMVSPTVERATVAVIDGLGRVVRRVEATTGVAGAVDLGALPAGTYSLRVELTDGRAVVRRVTVLD